MLCKHILSLLSTYFIKSRQIGTSKTNFSPNNFNLKKRKFCLPSLGTYFNLPSIPDIVGLTYRIRDVARGCLTFPPHIIFPSYHRLIKTEKLITILKIIELFKNNESNHIHGKRSNDNVTQFLYQ